MSTKGLAIRAMAVFASVEQSSATEERGSRQAIFTKDRKNDLGSVY